MRRFHAVLLCAGLGGCAMTPAMETDSRFAALDEKIATDAVAQLVRLYPPAKTQFNFRQFNFANSTGAGFGQLLIAKLRAKGYAITETAPPPARAVLPVDLFGAVFTSRSADTKMEEPSDPVKNPEGIELGYFLDHGRSADFSRITIKIGNSMLARAYLSDNGSIAPAGAWSYKE